MYHVEWLQTPLNELAKVWIQPDPALRKAVTRATQAIDLRLQNNPMNEGESRSGEEHFLIELPLGITYEIHEEQMQVWVTHIWYIRSKTK
jgi:hypothetical protein